MLNGVFKIVPPSYPLTPPLGLVPLRYGIYNDYKPPFLSPLPIRKRNCHVAGEYFQGGLCFHFTQG